MKAKTAHNKSKLARRHARIRSVVSGTADRPRLSVSRSNLYIVAQVIDDTLGKTLVAVTDKTQKEKTKTERAFAAGQALAKACVAAKITSVAFDRGGYQYHGRVKAFADGAREAGLQF